MRQYKYLFLLSFLLFSIVAQAQRIKPSSRIEKASDSTYILLSDVDGKYQHTKLVAESGINFNISNDTIYISATGGGASGVSNITGGLGIDPDGSNTGSVTLSFDPTEFGTLTTLDGNEDMWGYSSIIGQPVKYDIQGVFENVLTSSDGSVTISTSGTNQINLQASGGGGGLTQEQIQDSVGTMFGQNAFGIITSYNDLNGTVDIVASDVSASNELQDFDIAQLSGTDLELSLTQDATTHTIDLSSLGGGGGTDDQTIDVFSFSSPTLSLSLENDGEATKTVNLSTLTSGLMDNFNIQADGGATTSITDNETINFDAGTNMTISRTGNTILFESTGGGSGMTSWTARTEDLVTTTVSDGTILDFEAGNGLETQTSLGDIQILLDGPGLTNLGAIDGSYEAWVHSGVITGARTIQNILTDVLTSTDGSVTIGTSGNNVNLTASGGTDGDGNWDDASVYLALTGGVDFSSSNISSTYSDKRNFTFSQSLPSGSTSHGLINLPTAASTYQNHIIAVTCADNSASYDCIITNTGFGNYTMSDQEMVIIKASQYEGSWAWFIN